MNSTTPASPLEHGWTHVSETIFDAQLNLLRRQSSLQNTLANYKDPEDYRRAGWASELDFVKLKLAKIDGFLTAAYETAISASDCGNCSRGRKPHPAHTTPCSCGCKRTVRLTGVRP